MSIDHEKNAFEFIASDFGGGMCNQLRLFSGLRNEH